MNIDRVFLIVLDGVGAGELPDAHLYGDTGSNTLGNTARLSGGLRLPMLESMGLGCLFPLTGVQCVPGPLAGYGRMAEKSPGKDTTTGHWELAGLILDKPFPVFPGGFPRELVDIFERAAGTTVLGNEVASGTEIIARLGDEHVRTGYPILYTSADSVFQLAAHESIIPIERLYEMCGIARGILQGDFAVGRVIARPFSGESGSYSRTPRRKDFSLQPPADTILDVLARNGLDVWGVGKIDDIFANRGITWSEHTTDNSSTMAVVQRLADSSFRGLVFANCIDFDMVYGHRNDIAGFAGALQRMDDAVAGLCRLLTPRDLLIITADHGCDPTTSSTDHSREYVPLLAYIPGSRGADLGIRNCFCDVAATISECFDLPPWPRGTSFLNHLFSGKR